MSIREMPIVVCHHVYPDDASELLSATDEPSTCVPLVDLAGDPETTGRANDELARKPIGEAWHGAMVRLQGWPLVPPTYCDLKNN